MCILRVHECLLDVELAFEAANQTTADACNMDKPAVIGMCVKGIKRTKAAHLLAHSDSINGFKSINDDDLLLRPALEVFGVGKQLRNIKE